jgi:hypothetical protein
VSTYSTVLFRADPHGVVLDTWEIYRGPSLAAAVQLRLEAVQRLLRAFGWPHDALRPALGVVLLARGGSSSGADFELDRFALPAVEGSGPPRLLPAKALGPIEHALAVATAEADAAAAAGLAWEPLRHQVVDRAADLLLDGFPPRSTR